MVYVLNVNGQPLMPTNRYGKIRRLLKSKRAKVINRCPFTIQLLYETDNYTQPVSIGMDAGSKTIGVVATTETKVLYAAEVSPRNNIVNLLSTRREQRSARRNRKTRYRAPRFNNRVCSKHKGWLAPSVENKINTHIKAISAIIKILPVSEIHIETAEFDTQRLKALEEGKPLPIGEDYQLGELYDQYNVRQYVLFRDHYTCQCCKGKSKDKRLHVHHIESRKTGSESPRNKITLCETCHDQYHQGLIKLPDSIKKSASYRDAAFMGIMRKTFISRLKDLYPDLVIKETYGYITKYHRERLNIEKSHINDAIMISKNFLAQLNGEYFVIKPKRKHNRQIHKCTIGKGGVKKLNQTPKYVFGFQLFDKVKYNNQECFIFARRSSGYFDLRRLDGTIIGHSVSYKKIKLLEKRKYNLIERVVKV